MAAVLNLKFVRAKNIEGNPNHSSTCSALSVMLLQFKYTNYPTKTRWSGMRLYSYYVYSGLSERPERIKCQVLVFKLYDLGISTVRTAKSQDSPKNLMLLLNFLFQSSIPVFQTSHFIFKIQCENLINSNTHYLNQHRTQN